MNKAAPQGRRSVSRRRCAGFGASATGVVASASVTSGCQQRHAGGVTASSARAPLPVMAASASSAGARHRSVSTRVGNRRRRA